MSSASDLPQRISVAGHIMAAVACGVRNTLWIDYYVAALYLPKDAEIEAVRDASQPKAVLIRMAETRYLPERIPDKWLNALERDVAPARLEPVRRAYRSLATGDLVRFEYVPGRGVIMRVNGRTIARLPGQRVVDSILIAWADGENIEYKLRDLVQGQPC
jgi:hypothetical protein